VAEPMLFDARIEGLMREIAADPESSLLRVPRPARIGVVLERAPLVGIATAGLTLAEQELVRAHRGEVAYLLRKLAVVRLFESPKAAISRTRTNFASQPALEVERSKWLESAEAFAAEHPSTPEEADSGEELLLRCLRTPEEIGGVSVTAIAAAANQLEPTDQARIYAAQWLSSDEGEMDGARRILLDVLDAGASPTNAALAETNLGWIASQLREQAAACRWYAAGSKRVAGLVPALFGWLWAAAECQDTKELRSSAVAINEIMVSLDSGLLEQVNQTKTQMQLGSIQTSPQRDAALRDIADEMNGCVRLLVDALHRGSGARV
jgi:hypothetical protein